MIHLMAGQFCEACGTAIDPAMSRCPTCGASRPPATGATAPAGPSSRFPVVTVALVAAGLLLAVVAVVLTRSADDGDAPSATGDPSPTGSTETTGAPGTSGSTAPAPTEPAPTPPPTAAAPTVSPDLTDLDRDAAAGLLAVLAECTGGATVTLLDVDEVEGFTGGFIVLVDVAGTEMSFGYEPATGIITERDQPSADLLTACGVVP